MDYIILDNEKDENEMFEGFRKQMLMKKQSNDNYRGNTYEEGYKAGCKKGYEKGYAHGLEDAEKSLNNRRYM